MTDTAIARRYASALFNIGKKNGSLALNNYGESLEALSRAIQQQPKLAQIFKSPVIEVKEKKAVIDALLNQINGDKILHNFCHLLADKNRLDVLNGINEWYNIMLDNANGLVRGKVITALKLSPERQADIKEALEKKLGKKMVLQFCVDPEILGGMVLAVGDKILDSSLRAQLGMLRDILRRGM